MSKLPGKNKRNAGLYKNGSDKGVSGNKRYKTFLTTYSQPDGRYGWEIKATDFEQAEFICSLINHKLEGMKIRF